MSPSSFHTPRRVTPPVPMTVRFHVFLLLFPFLSTPYFNTLTLPRTVDRRICPPNPTRGDLLEEKERCFAKIFFLLIAYGLNSLAQVCYAFRTYHNTVRSCSQLPGRRSICDQSDCQSPLGWENFWLGRRMRPQPKRRIFLRNPSLGAMPLPNFVFKHRTHTKTQNLNLPNFPNRVRWGPTHLSSLWLPVSAQSCCHPELRASSAKSCQAAGTVQCRAQTLQSARWEGGFHL